MTGPAVFIGLALSLGAGRPVVGKATFDPKTASAGGRVLVLDSARPGDEEAIRLSEAVVVRRGGLSSRAGSAARRHGVPAVSLGQGSWEGTSLRLEQPSYGNPAEASGQTYRPVIGTEERVLREGDVVAVDPASGRLTLIPPGEAEDRLAAAEAALAYDGLRDPQALKQWLGEANPGRAAALLEELVPRAAAGLMPADDLTAVRRRADAALPASAREALRAAEGRAFARAARAAKRRAEECASDAADATDPAALERIADEAAASADGVAAVARLLAQPDGGAAALARECRAAALKRMKGRSPKALTFADAAAAAGADRPEGVELPEDSWKRFVDDNGLGDWLARTVDDSSLGLRRKSERIREKIAAGRLAPPSGLPPGPCLIVGEDAALKADGAEDAAKRVKDVWAASWAPGPLGARLRAGRALDYDGRVRVERVAAADASGLAFSRDPGSGRRERVLVEAVAGPLDTLLSGDAATETFALDRRTGREAAPRAGAGSAGLDAAELARVARVARALDAWKGAGVEVAFSFEGKRLLVHHARALEAPRPVVPLNDPFAPRPEAQGLDIKSVR